MITSIASAFTATCPNCETSARTNPDNEGKTVQCNKCKTKFVLQREAPPAEPEVGSTRVYFDAAHVDDMPETEEYVEKSPSIWQKLNLPCVPTRYWLVPLLLCLVVYFTRIQWPALVVAAVIFVGYKLIPKNAWLCCKQAVLDPKGHRVLASLLGSVALLTMYGTYRLVTGPPFESTMGHLVRNSIYSNGLHKDPFSAKLDDLRIIEFDVVAVGRKQRRDDLEYWPVQVAYTGTGIQYPTYAYGDKSRGEEVKFRGEEKFAIYKDEFGEWKAQGISERSPF